MSQADIYLFRLTQILALLLLPLVSLLSLLAVVLTFVLAVLLFFIAGMFALPVLMSLILFDLISDFSRSRFYDPVGRYIDLILMFPDTVWRSIAFVCDRVRAFLRNLLDYALE